MDEWVTRRRLLQGTGAAVAGGALLSGASGAGTAQQTGEEWGQFGYDDANTGHAPNNTGPVADISEQWQFETGDSVFSSPAVADGSVYVGSNDNNVYALDASDGTEQWSYEADAAMSSSPAVVDGTVYVMSERVYALDASDGAELWTSDTYDGARASPAVANNTVYVVSYTNSSVYALNATDGTEQWIYDTGDSAMWGSPAVVDDTVYIGSYNKNVYALDASDGTEQWSYDVGGSLDPSPAVANGTLYLGSWNGVYALDPSDGTEQWHYDTGDGGVGSPAVADGTVYIGSDDSSVYALDAADGTEQWNFETGGQVRSFPVVVDGTVYIGSDDSSVYALNASDGTEQWNFETGDAVRGSLAVADGTVYVGSSDNSVYALTGQTPSPTPADDPSSASTPTATDAPSSMETPTTGQPTQQDEESGGLGLLPVVAGLGVLGLGGGGGALWLARRDSDEPGTTAVDSDAPDDGTARSAGSSGGPRTTVDQTNSAANVTSESETTDEPGVGEAGKAREREPVSSASPTTRRIPESIPRAPDLSVDYDALTDEEPIGSGGNADVTRATLPTPEGDVTLAVKTPRMSGTLHTEQVGRLLDEAETWAKLDDHDHIVGVVDYGSQPLPWIAMEYMDGGDLSTQMDEMDYDRKLWTTIAITRGVRHAHQHGVAHLDLKPANVLFREIDDAWDVPKVADWGLSKHLLEHSQSVEGMSPHYAAPEQFDEAFGPTDHLTDVYQLGAVFYELFTGRPPFEGRPTKVMRAIMDDEPTPPSELADVPRKLDEVLLTALAKEKDDRYEDTLYLRDALQRLFDET